jgi:hypothetical protein
MGLLPEETEMLGAATRHSLVEGSEEKERK